MSGAHTWQACTDTFVSVRPTGGALPAACWQAAKGGVNLPSHAPVPCTASCLKWAGQSTQCSHSGQAGGEAGQAGRLAGTATTCSPQGAHVCQRVGSYEEEVQIHEQGVEASLKQLAHRAKLERADGARAALPALVGGRRGGLGGLAGGMRRGSMPRTGQEAAKQHVAQKSSKRKAG